MAKKTSAAAAVASTPDLTPDPATNWRPPGWRDGIKDQNAPDDGHTPYNTEASFIAYTKAGYYTSGGKLTEKGQNAKDSQTADDVASNRRALRNAWNTHPTVWRLAAELTGVVFKVDPYWNQGAKALPGLVRRLDGLTPETDGLAHDANGFPLNWRGTLKKGQAPAAANGPHSVTESWLKLCDAYGQEEVVAAFVPDNGDAWFQETGMKAQLVVRLGRVPCLPPPGIEASSPRGASVLLIWIPSSIDVKTLPKHTQDALKGKTFRVPMWTRARKGTQCAYVQPGSIYREVDLGLIVAPVPAIAS
jgi:hypothetical protein